MRDLPVILFLLCLGMIIAGCLASAESLTDQGEDLYASGKYEEALVKFDEALKVNATFIRALNGKGACLRETGDYQLAVACYDEALLIDPASVNACDGKVRALSAWGDAHAADEHYEKALLCYDEALALHPGHSDAIDGKYETCVALGDASSGEEALEYYDKALALRPGRLDAIEGKCRTYIALGDASSGQEALGYYDEALALRPEYSEAIKGKYLAYVTLGDASSGKEAIEYFAEALLIDPEGIEALMGKAKELSFGSHSGDRTSIIEAIQCYEQVLALSPDHPEAQKRLYELCDRMRPSSGEISPFRGVVGSGAHIQYTNQLKSDNSKGVHDAVAILINSQFKIVIYVRSGEKYTIYRIPNGSYKLYITTGEHWNPNSHKFMESVYYRKFESEIQFSDFYGYEGWYTRQGLKLYITSDGTASELSVLENEFPELS